jgi:hypothetical protein
MADEPADGGMAEDIALQDPINVQGPATGKDRGSQLGRDVCVRRGVRPEEGRTGREELLDERVHFARIAGVVCRPKRNLVELSAGFGAVAVGAGQTKMTECAPCVCSI